MSTRQARYDEDFKRTSVKSHCKLRLTESLNIYIRKI